MVLKHESLLRFFKSKSLINNSHRNNRKIIHKKLFFYEIRKLSNASIIEPIIISDWKLMIRKSSMTFHEKMSQNIILSISKDQGSKSQHQLMKFFWKSETISTGKKIWQGLKNSYNLSDLLLNLIMLEIGVCQNQARCNNFFFVKLNYSFIPWFLFFKKNSWNTGE